MKTYIALLRGINVSGQKSIKMDALKLMCERLHFKRIRTYIQSGNIVFQADDADADRLAQLMSAEIKQDFGFDVPVIVLSVSELSDVVKNNPYIDDAAKDRAHLHITFLLRAVLEVDLEAIKQKQGVGEEFLFTQKTVHLYCPSGYGKTKLTNTFFEKKLKVSATTRNWKTVMSLLQLAVE